MQKGRKGDGDASRTHPVPPEDDEDMVAGFASPHPVPQRFPHGRVPMGRRRPGLPPVQPSPTAIPLKRGISTPVTTARSRGVSSAADARSGPVTGARVILLLLARGPTSPGQIASLLGMEESYIRRVCRTLHGEKILTCTVTPQKGTPPLGLYALVPTTT